MFWSKCCKYKQKAPIFGENIFLITTSVTEVTEFLFVDYHNEWIEPPTVVGLCAALPALFAGETYRSFKSVALYEWQETMGTKL
jgi:hypothetical protein